MSLNLFIYFETQKKWVVDSQARDLRPDYLFWKIGLRCIVIFGTSLKVRFSTFQKKKTIFIYLSFFFNLLSSIVLKDFKFQTNRKFTYFATKNLLPFFHFSLGSSTISTSYSLTVCHLVYFLVMFLLKCLRWIIVYCYFGVVYYFYWNPKLCLCWNELNTFIFP